VNRLALLIPARDAASVLPRLLESADQDGGFDEILVYDDASSDGTGGVARRAGARVIRTDVNTGPSIGKNKLAALATSEWLHFHDADDALAPDFVDRTRQWIALDGCDALLFGTEDRDDRTGAVLGRRTWDDAELRTDAVRYHIVNTVTNCGVYRRDRFVAAGGFDSDPATKYNEDQAMHLRLAFAGLRFRADESTGVIIYRRAGSMSSGRPVDCARAQVEVLARAAARTGARYRDEIGSRLWRLAGVCGGFQDWVFVDRCLKLAAEIGYGDPKNEHWLVRALAAVDATTAVRIRERLIRLLKPGLREGMPVVEAGKGR